MLKFSTFAWAGGGEGEGRCADLFASLICICSNQIHIFVRVQISLASVRCPIVPFSSVIEHANASAKMVFFSQYWNAHTRLTAYKLLPRPVEIL